MSILKKMKNHIPLFLLCLMFFVFGCLRLNDTSLYTDSTRYVIWGTSFGHARGFVDDTQPDPERYVVNAPLYSVVLAPVLLVFPYSLTAAKVCTLLVGLCVLILFYVWSFRRYGKSLALMGTLILASNPLMLVMATEAMSEMCFLALAILAMILLNSFEGDRSFVSRQSIGLLVILSILPILREVSVALVGSAVIVLLSRRYYRNALWIVVGAGILLVAWMIRNLVIVGTPSTSQSTNTSFIFGHFVTSSDASTASELLQRALLNVKAFYVFSVSLLMYPFPQPLIVDPSGFFKMLFKSLSVAKYVLPFFVLPLVGGGLVRDFRTGYKSQIGALFVVFYFVIIVVYPIQDARFLLPLLPFGIYYSLLVAQVLSNSRVFQRHDVRLAVSCVLLALTAGPNLICDIELARTNWSYTHSPAELYDKISKTHTNKELFIRPWRLLGDWVTSNVPDSVVIASTYKEASIFIGHRKILEINYGVPTPMFERFLRDYGVEYVLAAGEREFSRPYEFVMREARNYWFEPVYSLSGLVLYRVHSALLAGNAQQEPKQSVGPDTAIFRQSLYRGRTALLKGDYDSAIANFVAAGNQGANPALVSFQLTIAYAMSSKAVEAGRSLEQLYSMPQSTSYIPAARMHLQAMQTYLSGVQQADILQSSVQIFDAASFYWNFGYRNQAYSLVREILRKDNSYFSGLLWGWDYALQMGDKPQARAYLKTLESIDSHNAVVEGFRSIDAIEDTLSRAKDSRERSRLRLEAANVYWNVGLPDEAFDSAESAIGEDPRNQRAFENLVSFFERTNKPWAIRRLQRSIPH